MDMLERAARAISIHVAYRPWDEMAKDRSDLRAKIRDGYDVNEPTQSDCIDAAHEMLHAIREPSADVSLAGVCESPYRWEEGRETVDAIWQAMIDAIIGTKGGE